MDFQQTFEAFLATQNVQISIPLFLINIALAAFLAFLLGIIYTNFGTSVSNRKAFANNFMLLATTTMIIITIVKSSLALSLGLVGALSIVRFRSAIKEPEELAYLFLTIAIGLGLGADQWKIVLTGFSFVAVLLIARGYLSANNKGSNLLLTITSGLPQDLSMTTVINALNQHCTSVDIKRIDENKNFLEASFLVGFNDFEDFEKIKKALKEVDNTMGISFVDNKRLLV